MVDVVVETVFGGVDGEGALWADEYSDCLAVNWVCLVDVVSVVVVDMSLELVTMLELLVGSIQAATLDGTCYVSRDIV